MSELINLDLVDGHVGAIKLSWQNKPKFCHFYFKFVIIYF